MKDEAKQAIEAIASHPKTAIAIAAANRSLSKTANIEAITINIGRIICTASSIIFLPPCCRG